ncbi:hypothetical protein EI427_16900 [Flammeovirga pectinis]|uniref:Uncharacterized protein n=1 Tax=Flammeovirga pectinis TaxID=2494373 RepID=A0A3Q9FST7_9BACT|nr:hypothetical protein [Flammeovirga pectinis]AZQ63844.1 hypothetical protein EI427_16900 [Flammeovirga pectinis]
MKILTILTIGLFMGFKSYAQTFNSYYEFNNLEEQKRKYNEAEDRIYQLEWQNEVALRKLNRNKTVKTIGMVLDGVSLFILWPLAIPGTIMWVASPTKKHQRTIDGNNYQLHKMKQIKQDIAPPSSFSMY